MRTYIKFITLAVASATVFSGCSYTLDEYKPSLNINTYNLDNKMSIDKGNNVILNIIQNKMCGVSGVVKAPNKQPLHLYIEDAFVSELKNNSLYSKNSKEKVALYINSIESSIDYGDSYLLIDATIKSTNGFSYDINSMYEYDGHPMAVQACEMLKENYQIGIKMLISNITKHQDFKNLF